MLFLTLIMFSPFQFCCNLSQGKGPKFRPLLNIFYFLPCKMWIYYKISLISGILVKQGKNEWKYFSLFNIAPACKVKYIFNFPRLQHFYFNLRGSEKLYEHQSKSFFAALLRFWDASSITLPLCDWSSAIEPIFGLVEIFNPCLTFLGCRMESTDFVML